LDSLTGPLRVENIKGCYGLKREGGGNTDTDNEKINKKAKPQDEDKDNSDLDDCASEYRSCVEKITSLDACISRKQRGCMRDCLTNYSYGRVACEQRFCNPDAGTNGRWEESCNKRIDEEKGDCARERTECRNRSRKRESLK
jgi:hypothetical protein